MCRTLPLVHRRSGFTLIELLVVITVIGVLDGLLVPAVQAAREAARRSRCTNNLKQIALAAQLYHDANGSFPIGVPMVFDNDPAMNFLCQSHSPFVAMLPYLEQRPLYDAVNFDRAIYHPANYTIFATGLDVLWCPSDPDVQMESTYVMFHDPLVTKIRYSSYAGNTGTRNVEPYLYGDPRNEQRNGQVNGIFAPLRTVSVAEVRDGLSSTMLFSERAHGRLTGQARLEWHWWADGTASDTRFWTLFPMNPFQKIPDFPESGYFSAYASAASSFHPGGANFAFADGSVRFIKDSIDTWPADPATGYPVGVSQDANGFYQVAPEVRPGVYQNLSTIAGGEVVSSGSY